MEKFINFFYFLIDMGKREIKGQLPLALILILLVVPFVISISPDEKLTTTGVGTASGSGQLGSLENTAKERAYDRAKDDAKAICDGMDPSKKAKDITDRGDADYSCPGPNISNLKGEYTLVKCKATIAFSCK